jgi:homoaconitase/3-isopropylmalate dehydratase large subunit
VAALWATGELWLRVPQSMLITLEGELPPGVTAKDFALRVIGDLGADGGLYMSVEFTGSGIAALSLESRMVIPNMMAEFGAKNAYLAPDAQVVEYLAQRLYARRAGGGEADHGHEGVGAAQLEDVRVMIAAGCLFADEGADYAARYHYRAAELETYIACPHTMDNVAPLSQVAGTPIQQAFLGTCTNGRLEDLAAAAAVLRGRQVAPGVRMIVIPASREVLKEALAAGYIQTFVEAGAVIGVPGCGPCMGNHMGIPAPGEVTISSANRNFRGRMGTPDSEIYLSNPAVVAASAVKGAIAGPQEVME